MPTLLNRHLSDYTFREYHQTVVHASPALVYTAILNLNFRKSRVIHTLFRLRGLRTGTLREMLDSGMFHQIASKQGEELLIALLVDEKGRIVSRLSSKEFRDAAPKRGLRIAWNFLLLPRDANSIMLSTETRVRCHGVPAYLLFAPYWLMIRPFSGWIRREMLKLIKGDAEIKRRPI